MVGKDRGSRKANRRAEILQAAERLLLSRGLSGITTRQISKQAGCSEGALYVHFKGRLELLLAMLEDSLPEMLGPLRTLQQKVGHGSPQTNLATALRGIYKFHQRATPRVAGLFADPELHAAFRSSLIRQNKGPHLSLKVLEDYITAEQEMGRVDQRVDAKLAAYLLMSSSFFRAFSEQFFGRPMRPAWSKLLDRLIRTVVPTTAN
ncbi:MAG: TetR/AcrR family transcriptional regulator [Candidatus Sulfotelmatobacter sp.]